MPTLDQIASQPQAHRIILFGAPGSGKTWAIGKLATTHKLHYFSLENGHQTLLNPDCVPVEARKNIEIIQMFDTPETPIAATSLDSFFKTRKGSFCEAHGRNDCPLCRSHKDTDTVINIESLTPKDILIFDSLTQWEASISFYLTKSTDGELERSGDKVFDYYRKLALYLSRSLSRIQLIKNCSFIVISHETGVETVAGNDKIVPAGGSKNFARNNARFFDGVYYLYKENKKHKMASSSLYSTVIDTKDRTAFDSSKFRDPGSALLALFNPSMTDSILRSEEPVKGK